MTDFKQYVSPHVHIKSLDSASTPEGFAEREVELNTGYVTCTDHGTMEATREVYELCNGAYKGKLKPILGVEAYFRDDNCPHLHEAGYAKDVATDQKTQSREGTYCGTIKYCHVTLHAMDEQAYFALVKRLSSADYRAEQHGSERKPLFTWQDLEELGQYNITVTSGCLIGMVGRLMVKKSDLSTAIKYYEHLRSAFKPGNTYVEVFPHKTDKYWQEAVQITFADAVDPVSFKPTKKIKTQGTDDVYASDLASEFKKNPVSARAKHKAIIGMMDDRKWVEWAAPRELVDVVHEAGFVSNECQPLFPDGDAQRTVNAFVISLARKYGDRVLISDDAHFSHPEQKIVQDIRLSQGNTWKFYNSYHRQSSAEAFPAFSQTLGITENVFEGWIENSREWASRFDAFKFTPRRALPTSFYPKLTLEHTMKLIEQNGRMNWSNSRMVERLHAEIKLLHKNGTIDLLPYFMIDQEVVDLYARNGELTGPGRGSAAGLLLAYLLGITHVDPLRYVLSMDRFMTPDRIATNKLPDIDQDLPHRDLLVDPNDSSKGWLRERFGDCVAQISTDTTMKLKSACKDVFRALHGHEGVKVASSLVEDLPDPPQGIDNQDFVFGYEGSEGWVPGLIDTSPQLQAFSKSYAKEWNIIQRCLGLARQKSRHACAFVIADTPIDEFIPLTTVSDVRVTQFTAPAVEAAGGLKMDFLVVNSLRDINQAVRLVQDRHRSDIDWSKGRVNVPQEAEIPYVTIDGKKVYTIRCMPIPGTKDLADIWDLPADQKVFADICHGDTESVFQFNTPGARQWLRNFDAVRHVDDEGNEHYAIDSIEGMSAFTALDRPGPLDAYVEAGDGSRHNMLVEYAHRAKGLPAVGELDSLNKLLPETFGVIVYQEQLQSIFQNVGGTTAIQANDFRQHISKKQMAKVLKDRELFMVGAVEKLGEDEAKRLWNMMETFGQYGFNKSHSVCYVIISYACAYLKHHYPIEWWTAVLRNAERNEITSTFWHLCGDYIDFPDLVLSGDKFDIVGGRIRAPLWLMKGVGDKAQAQLTEMTAGGPFLGLDDFCERMQAWRIKHATTVTDKEGNPKLKLATNALNTKVVTTLIVTGAMDALFKPLTYGTEQFELSLSDKLRLFEEAFKRATKKKPTKRKGVPLTQFSDLMLYQMKKDILPPLTQPLLEYVKPLLPEGMLVPVKNAFGIRHKTLGDNRAQQQDYPLVSKKTLEWVLNAPLKNDVCFAGIGYVSASRHFEYTRNGKKCGALGLIIDVEGAVLDSVKWPHGQKLPDHLKDQDLTGAVVVVTCSRRVDKKASIEDVIVIQRPLKETLEKTLAETKTLEMEESK